LLQTSVLNYSFKLKLGAVNCPTTRTECVCVGGVARSSLEKCYQFTELAVQLNEMEVGVAPTDSRCRPDQRLMELGRWDDANACKLVLEDKQRTARRQREREMEQAAATGTHRQTDRRTGTDRRTDGRRGVHCIEAGACW